jgi:hypothetical protein
VQNQYPSHRLGEVTAGLQFFRSIGSTDGPGGVRHHPQQPLDDDVESEQSPGGGALVVETDEGE